MNKNKKKMNVKETSLEKSSLIQNMDNMNDKKNDDQDDIKTTDIELSEVVNALHTNKLKHDRESFDSNSNSNRNRSASIENGSILTGMMKETDRKSLDIEQQVDNNNNNNNNNNDNNNDNNKNNNNDNIVCNPEGLTSIEASRLLDIHGYNVLPEEKRSKFLIFIDQLTQPMPIMIWVAVIIGK